MVELHAFLAVARCGSFRSAADALAVTQAAVSRAVQRLEAQLGFEVFARTGGGVRLTPQGEDLRARTERHVTALEAAALAVRRQPERLRLRLSVAPSIGHLWLLPRLEGFRALHPEVAIEFRQYHHEETFERDDVDLWIALKARAQQRWPRQIAADYLIGREIVAVCAPRRAARIHGAAQLLEQPLLYHSNYPDNWSLWAQAVGASLPAGWHGTGFDLVMNLVEAVRADMGVAVVQRCMVEADLASGRLVTPVPQAASTGRGYYLCRRRAVAAHPAGERFAQWLRQEAGAGR
nr:LysR substrate-binding domain-containing protein [Ramlibacter aurantiacus]